MSINMSVFLLNSNGFVLNIIGFFLKTTMIGLALKNTKFILKIILQSLNMTAYVHNETGYSIKLGGGKINILKSKTAVNY